MIDKHFNRISLAVSILLLLVAVVLAQPVIFGICDVGERFTCVAQLSDMVGTPLLIWALSLIVVSILANLLSVSVTKMWKVVSGAFILVSAVTIYFTPVICGEIFCLDKEKVSWLSAGIFSLVNLVVIIYSKLKKVG